MMDIAISKMIDISPPVMKRYEDMVRKQREAKTILCQPCCLSTRSYLKAPIQRDAGFVGISFNMTPAPDYWPIVDDEVIAKRDFMCNVEIIPTERLQLKMGEGRRHGILQNGHELLYFPMIYGRHCMETDFANYLWVIRSCRAKPDKEYLMQLKRSLLSAAKRFWRLQKSTTIHRMVLNDSLYCLSWFDNQSRHQLIHILANTFREQKELMWISAENAELSQDDGIRLLLAISVTTGHTLETLHLWHFFREDVLPIKNKGMSQEDVFIIYKLDITDETMKNFFFNFASQTKYTIPPILSTLALHTAYLHTCLEYLKVLSVEYRYLTGGKGESLLYLGCIISGSLRQLNILFTECDSVKNTKRLVCAAAWKKAFKMCPCFRVNFIVFRVSSFSLLLDTLVQYIPIEGFFTSTGFKCDDKPLYLGMLTATLTKYYKRFLKILSIHLNRPRLCVDFLLSKLLMELPFLEEFTYKGPFDNITSLFIFFQYIKEYPLRIKKLHLYLTEDPCQPEPYKQVMNQIFRHLEPMFIDKGIDFKLATCQC